MSKNTTENMKVSDKIKAFTDLLNDIKQNYEYAMSMVKQLDKEYDLDLGHEFELRTAKESAKIATKARRNRLDRRYYKDRAEELEPLYELIYSADNYNNKKAFDKLQSVVLGATRKAENYHKDRTYKPRVNENNIIDKRLVK